jgi:hypothetical protein
VEEEQHQADEQKLLKPKAVAEGEPFHNPL